MSKDIRHTKEFNELLYDAAVYRTIRGIVFKNEGIQRKQIDGRSDEKDRDETAE
jgi:hypothetical protein